jgi:plasmid replication initiation protein
MVGEQPTASERATLYPVEALAGDVPPRDQRDLMERPFFSPAKAKRVTIYQAGETQVQVFANPEHGMATIWDPDVLIWAASQILAAQDRGLSTSRFFRYTPYQLLIAVGRATGNREYLLLKIALTRLQSTVIRTTIRHGQHWRRQQFSWINEWEELTTRTGRCEGMEFVLPEWFCQGVLDRRLVLAIDPAYFALSGGIERWLYRVARKHAGRQRDGWRFELRHLHAKSASLARFSDFALDIRRIVARQPLPGYRLALERRGRELIVALVNQQDGVGKTTLALHLAGVWACQGRRVAVIDANPGACTLEWSELRVHEGVQSRFTLTAIARDTLHRELPTVARDVDRMIIDGPSHIEAITRSALIAAISCSCQSSLALARPGICRNAAACERDDDRSTATAHPTRSQPLQRARHRYAGPDARTR